MTLKRRVKSLIFRLIAALDVPQNWRMNNNNTKPTPASIVLLEWVHVKERCKLSRSEIYRRIKRKTFPAPVKLSPRKNVWPEYIIEKWISDHVKGTV